MARLHHVKKARKAYRKHRILKGQQYWWYKHSIRHAKVYCTIKPPRSAYATTSPVIGQLMDMADAWESASWKLSEKSGLETMAAQFASDVEELINDNDGKISNLEEAFPNGCPTLETLNERKEELEALLEELQTAESDLGAIDEAPLDGEPDEEDEEAYQAYQDEINEKETAIANVRESVSWPH